jgi:phosphate transport system ATP-binding protein
MAGDPGKRSRRAVLKMENDEMATQSPTIGITVGAPSAPIEADRSMVAAPAAPEGVAALEVRNLTARYGAKVAVRDVNLDARQRSVTAIIGPSGSGKSTLLRALNRMLEVVPSASISGSVRFHGVDIYDPKIEPAAVRRTIGMVFQQPNPFPTMSIFENVAAPARFNGLVRSKADTQALVERCLRQAVLWDEVKDSLGKSGASLSGGQQQRLCIARALAVNPEVILMDEPCSALDPIATLQIEELARELRQQYAIVVVTHNMQQAARVSDETIFMSVDGERAGYIVETGATAQIFTNPVNKITEDYITGRFG